MIIKINKKRFVLFILIISFLLTLLLSKPIKKLIYPMLYNDIVTKYTTQYNVDPLLVMAVMKAESGFNKDANSRADARGLMQLTDSTALWCAEEMELYGFKIEDVYDPEKNIRIGVWYINYLMDTYNNDIIKALAAYNAGGSNVNEWVNNNDTNNLEIENIPFNETKVYLKKILQYYEEYQKLYRSEYK